MDLLACSDCGRRFYLPGVRPGDQRLCPSCGGPLDLARHGMTSIPLDARWLDPRAGPGDGPQIAVVALRRKRGGEGGQILADLGEYFAIEACDGSIEVSVNRGAPTDAALRVAAVLDGIDPGWEEHFYLPTDESQPARRVPEPQSDNVFQLLPRIGSDGNGDLAEGPA